MFKFFSKTTNQESRYSRLDPIIEPEIENSGQILTTGMPFSDWAPTLNNMYGGSTSEQKARQISTVWRCISLISGGIATMPIHFYERTGLGESTPIDHDYWYLLNINPHPNYTSATMKEAIIADMLLQGDGFCKIIRKSQYSNDIVNLEWAQNTRTSVFMDEDHQLFYAITDPTQKLQEVAFQSDVIHIPGAGFNGIKGMSAIQHALKPAIDIALATDQHTKAFFENGTRPEYAITFPEGQSLKPNELADFKASLNEFHQGSKNANKPLIVTKGAKISPMALSTVDSQLIQSRQFQVDDIARFFGVPSHMVNSPNATSWGTGIEQMSIAFVQYCLMPIIVKMEQEINRKFFETGSKLYCKFDVSTLERGDYKSRMDGYRVALGRAGEQGIMTVNEVRKKEGLQPIEGGDELQKWVQTPNQQATDPAPEQDSNTQGS